MRNKKKRTRTKAGKIITILAVAVAIFQVILSSFNHNDNFINQNAEKEDTVHDSLTGLDVHFIDVGQGDSTLIICDNEAMLIDAGDNNKGMLVENYIKKQGVDNLKYVIATHPDADHIGGLDVVLYKFNCENILMTNEQKDTATYRDVVDTIKYKNYKTTLPVTGNTYKLGAAYFTIISPCKTYSESNDNSIVILLTHGNNKFLFTGDATETSEKDMINLGISLEADVYKVSHHGSKYSSSIDFINAVNPTYAVISCGDDNSYGHPHAEVLNNLRMADIKVFRTDEQGSIIAHSNGNYISWNCSPTDTWKSGEPH